MFVLHKKENNICKITCVTYVQQDNVQRLISAMAFIFTDTEKKKPAEKCLNLERLLPLFYETNIRLDQLSCIVDKHICC